MNRPLCHPRECRGQIHNEIQDHRGWLPGRTHRKFFNKRKRDTSNSTKKVFSVHRLSRLCGPIRVGRLLKLLVGYCTDSEQGALWIRNPWFCDIPPMWAKRLSHLHDWAQRPFTTFQSISHVRVGYLRPLWFTMITCVWLKIPSGRKGLGETIVPATCVRIRVFMCICTLYKSPVYYCIIVGAPNQYTNH